MVVPELGSAMKKGGWNPPIAFKEQTGTYSLPLEMVSNFFHPDLIREDQSNIEKNWSPFLGENDEVRNFISKVLY